MMPVTWPTSMISAAAGSAGRLSGSPELVRCSASRTMQSIRSFSVIS
jgi:hypothetical protein